MLDFHLPADDQIALPAHAAALPPPHPSPSATPSPTRGEGRALRQRFRKSPTLEIGRGAYAALSLLPLWEKVARREAPRRMRGLQGAANPDVGTSAPITLARV